MTTFYKNGATWIWNTDLDKLKRIFLRGAAKETTFSKWSIGEAIDNAKLAKPPPTRAEIETADALTEDILL